MSLVAVRNFIAPLQSKPQLGAIILAAIVVAVVRLSGFGVAPSGNASIDPSDRSLRPAREEASEDVTTPQDSLLDDLLKQDTRPKRRAAPTESPDGGLRDIRRSLGLE